MSGERYDVVVVGAGVFGVWTAASLHRAGQRVAVVDTVGPAHTAASSGGESRVIRCGYGSQDIYTEWADRSLAEWQALSDRASVPLFHPIGALWIHTDGDELVEASAEVLSRHGVPFERLSAPQIRDRYPVVSIADDEAGFLEPKAGGVMARRAVQQLAAELEAEGVRFHQAQIRPIGGDSATLASVTDTKGRAFAADRFVVACGPWLSEICPDVMGDRLFVTRQDIVFFAAHRDATGDLGVWADLPFYGLPSLEGRGFKIANDTHGPRVDMGNEDGRPSPVAEEDARAFLSRRFPSIADAPVSETRVCRYENSSNGDFLIDRHPSIENVWLVGCGSGHGFKHGPALGAHVAGLVLGTEQLIDRFSFATKATAQQRAIQ